MQNFTYPNEPINENLYEIYKERIKNYQDQKVAAVRSGNLQRAKELEEELEFLRSAVTDYEEEHNL